jgi:uncharacterized surface protein with fasciclin (FAS1) repeats
MTTPIATSNIVDTAAANGQFGVFGKAVATAGLTDTLKGVGPFTVFAPTDAAFNKLPPGTLDRLLKPENKAELASILTYHVVTGRNSAAEVGKMDKTGTVNGQSAPITMSNGKVSIDGAHVVAADIATSNGVIHGIDKVNLPKVH